MYENEDINEILIEIKKIESNLLELADKKVRPWNIFDIVKRIKRSLILYFYIVSSNFKSVARMSEIDDKILEILRMQQQQLDNINRSIEEIKNGKSGDNYGN